MPIIPRPLLPRPPFAKLGEDFTLLPTRPQFEQPIGVAVRKFLQICGRQFEPVKILPTRPVAAKWIIDREQHTIGPKYRQRDFKRRPGEQSARGDPNLV